MYLLGCLIIFSLALAFAAIKGLDIACGCFGSSESTNYPLAFIRNGCLLGFGIFLFLKSKNLSSVFNR